LNRLKLRQIADALDPLLVNDAALRADIGMGKKQIARFRAALAAAKGGALVAAAQAEAAQADAAADAAADPAGDPAGAADAAARAARLAKWEAWEEEYDVAAALADLEPPTPVGARRLGSAAEEGDWDDSVTAHANLDLRPPSAFAVMRLKVGAPSSQLCPPSSFQVKSQKEISGNVANYSTEGRQPILFGSVKANLAVNLRGCVSLAFCAYRWARWRTS
jgi:hypothetical protein